jgi:hypothetical protein
LSRQGGAAPAGLRGLKLEDVVGLVRTPLFLLFLLAASLIQSSHALYYSFGMLNWRAQAIPDDVMPVVVGGSRRRSRFVRRIGPCHCL